MGVRAHRGGGGGEGGGDGWGSDVNEGLPDASAKVNGMQNLLVILSSFGSLFAHWACGPIWPVQAENGLKVTIYLWSGKSDRCTSYLFGC